MAASAAATGAEMGKVKDEKAEYSGDSEDSEALDFVESDVDDDAVDDAVDDEDAIAAGVTDERVAEARALLGKVLEAGAVKALVATRRYRLRSYKNCLVGSEFVTWLVEQGLAADREAAVAAGRLLHDAEALVHVVRARAFHDDYLFYRLQEDADAVGKPLANDVAAACGDDCLRGRGATQTDSRGVAAGGFDVVNYFTDGKARKGSKEFTAEHGGATYRFASAEHRDRFVAAPADFTPQCGGYCAWAAGQRMVAPASPRVWDIVEGKLYFNNNPLIRQAWSRQTDAASASEARWSELVAESVAKREAKVAKKQKSAAKGSASSGSIASKD